MRSEITNRNLYTFTEKDYLALEKTLQEWQAQKFAKLVELVSSIQPREILADVGCFTGIGTQLYQDIDGVNEVHGFDASENALSRAEKRQIVVHRWMAGEEDCPMNDNGFDVTVAADIIEHLINTQYFIQQLIRITRPKGYIIISTPNLVYWHSRARLLLGKPPWSYPGVSSNFKHDPAIDLNHIRINVPKEWGCFFEANGLKLVNRYGYRLEGVMAGIRKGIDVFLTRFPDLAFGNIFLLQNAKSW
jgi:SAM-dependent methyltransferase